MVFILFISVVFCTSPSTHGTEESEENIAIPSGYKIHESILIDGDDELRSMAREEGVLCGISAGANVWAAVQVAKRPENTGKTIVTIICDTGERYLSTPLFQEG